MPTGVSEAKVADPEQSPEGLYRELKSRVDVLKKRHDHAVELQRKGMVHLQELTQQIDALEAAMGRLPKFDEPVAAEPEAPTWHDHT